MVREPAKILLCLAALVAVAGPAWAGPRRWQEAAEIHDRARAVTLLPGDADHRLAFVADVYVREMFGEGFLGQILWVRPARDTWRVRIALPGYHEDRGAGSGSQWKFRTLGWEPLSVGRLNSLLRFAPDLELGREHRVLKVRRKKVKGTEVHCVRLDSQNPRVRWTSRCFDAVTGALVEARVAYRHGRVDTRAYEFADHATWEGMLFPRTIRLRENGQVQAALRVRKFLPAWEPPEDFFQAPRGALVMKWCETWTPPRLVRSVRSGDYPRFGKDPSLRGTYHVLVHAVVGIDGRPRVNILRSSGNPTLDGHALWTMEGFRYLPATCNGDPVEHELPLFAYVFDLDDGPLLPEMLEIPLDRGMELDRPDSRSPTWPDTHL